MRLYIHAGYKFESTHKRPLRMSFLAGRLAGKEGAYFFQESKHAVGRLVEKTKSKFPSSSSTTIQSSEDVTKLESSADILPEVLRHSLPSKIFRPPPPSDSSLSTASKWALPSDPKSSSFVSREALNPLRAYVSLPQVTFGPKRSGLSFVLLIIISLALN